jgi:hypothetical protein
MTKGTERVNTAIDTTKTYLSDYFRTTCQMRLAGADEIGSGFEVGTIEELETILRTAEWWPYSNTNIAPGCIGLSANIPGLLGVVSLATLDESTICKMIDPKGTGQTKLIVVGTPIPVDFTVIILGEDEGHEVVYTFHPGAPVALDRNDMIPERNGQTLTVAEAKALGFTTANLVKAL